MPTSNPVNNAIVEMYQNILENGSRKPDRTGTGTISLLGNEMRFDLRDGKLALFTLRPLFTKSIVVETLWFISGDTNIRFLKERGVGIWDSWVKPGTEEYTPEGKLAGGSIGSGAYGSQWRHLKDTRIIEEHETAEYLDKGFAIKGQYLDEDNQTKLVVHREIDQLQNAIDLLRRDPYSRRILVCTFNPAQVDFCQLPPCHSFYQFVVFPRRLLDVWNDLQANPKLTDLAQMIQNDLGSGMESLLNPSDKASRYSWSAQHEKMLNENGIATKELSMKLVCRSQDCVAGTVFNVAQYSMLLHMVAQCVGMTAGDLVWTAGDQHIYLDQIYPDVSKRADQLGVVEVLGRFKEVEASGKVIPVPRIELNPAIREISDFKLEDIKIVDYEPYGSRIFVPIAV